MSIIVRKEIARILIIAFVFFLIPSDSFSVKKDEKTGLKLIKQAEKLFKNYKYQDSINKFRDAEKYVKLEKNLSRLYLGISRSYYAIGLMSQVKEAINKLAMLSVKSSFKKSKYPRGYLKIYNDIQAEIEKKKKEELITKSEEEPESLYQVEKTGEETKEITKKPLAGVIEKPGKKKKKKKSLLLPITLGAVALGAVVMLMGKKSDGGGDTASNTASVHIESAPSGASVFVDGASKGVVTPCDITVAEGSREIRVQIEGWGETRSTQSFIKDNNYTMNGQLAPYKYHAVHNFPIHSSINIYCWDVDHSGNIYGVYRENNGLKMAVYNSYGVEQNTYTLLWPGDAPENFKVHYNNYTNQLYIYVYQSTKFYIYDPEGIFIAGHSVYQPQSVSEFNSGDILINSSYVLIKRYNSNFELIEELIKPPLGFLVVGIKCSDDDQSIFVGRSPEHNVSKYDQTGNFIQSWKAHGGYWFHGSKLTSFGQSDLEKVIIGTSNNVLGHRLEFYTGDGEFLTATEAIDYIDAIAEDNSYNIYAHIGSNFIQKYEPSSETEGTGFWETSSVASTASRIGSLGTTRIDPSQQKRASKPEIKKEKREKRR